VRELARYLARKFNDPQLAEIGVRGEITGANKQQRTPGGTRYFSLKGPGVILPCIAFKETADALGKLEDGVEAIAYGRLGFYEDQNKPQLYVARIELVGSGSFAAIYERTKRKLEAEGLFDPARKRPLPRFPFRIVLVSSPGADGANDFVGALRERCPYLDVRLEPTLVQGPNAPSAIVQALARAGRSGADVIVVARGGGSDEDRIPFNDEQVARAIARSPIPVMTAIGHRGDNHIADEVADLRADVPRDAANLIIAGFDQVQIVLRQAEGRMRSTVLRRIENAQQRVGRLASSPFLNRFERIAGAKQQTLDLLAADLSRAHAAAALRKSSRIASLERRLHPFEPSRQLASRGVRLAQLKEALTLHWTAYAKAARRDLSDRSSALERAIDVRLRENGRRVERLGDKLAGADPVKVLQLGYAIVRKDGRAVRDASQFSPGDALDAQLARGTVRARVEESKRDE
jgi:exodeoxyribonuclease VII large subunit